MDHFPIPYTPVRYPFFGVNSTVSGVGFNIARALAVLGDAVNLLTLVGCDPAAELVRRELRNAGIIDDYVVEHIGQTAQSVILFDSDGRRQINVDLKDIQEQSYPETLFLQALDWAALVVLCNVNFSRELLKIAREKGKTIATDVHAISSIDDAYNGDFMAAAQILFMSDELLPESPVDFVRRVADRFGSQIIVIGMGRQGALLYQRQYDLIEMIPPATPRTVVSTIGAGDALFSCFLHYYALGLEPAIALSRAAVFAGYKIGETGAAQGFLNQAELEEQILLLKGR